MDNPSVLKHAISSGTVDHVSESVTALRDVDLIVLAAPVCQNIQLIRQIGVSLAGPLVVTDVGGTKQEIVAAARTLPSSMTFLGGHPLGGSERGGFPFARPDLFVGRPWIFAPDGKEAVAVLDRLSQFVAGFGATPTTLDPAIHDRLMAFLSHLPQLASTALMDIVGNAAGKDGLTLAGQGLADTTRLASSPARVWRDICVTNADEIGAALDLLIARLTEIRADLRRGEALDQVFDAAGRWRAELMKGRE